MVFKSVVGALGSPLFRNSSLPEDPVILEEVKNPFKIVPYVYYYCSVNGSESDWNGIFNVHKGK